jgi:hypothetical protein
VNEVFIPRPKPKGNPALDEKSLEGACIAGDMPGCGEEALNTRDRSMDPGPGPRRGLLAGGLSNVEESLDEGREW